MNEKEKMLDGRSYNASDPELVAARNKAEDLIRNYNFDISATRESKEMILTQLLGSLGKNATIRAPFYCDYGSNIFLGDGVFINFNAVFLDIMPIRIGDGTQIGPNVQFYAADHPREVAARKHGVESGKPITIGKNVWIGGGVIILPGVTIGNEAIIGAGSVVTHDVIFGETVVGNPARPVNQ